MLKNSDSSGNKTKIVKSSIVVIAVILAFLAASLGYYYIKQQANIKQKEEGRKRAIMGCFPFSNYQYEENGYEEFLKDENLPIILLRFKEYMDTHHPSIGYGTRYKEITVERLANDYVKVAEDIRSIAKDIRFIVDDFSQEETDFDKVIFTVLKSMWMDGIWVQRGTMKVEYDSAEAIMRKSKAWCMDYLYIDGYVSDYIIFGYEEIHFEAFLADERLPVFLADMKEYMNTHYPEIGYGSQYEEITVERLKSDYETVYLELEEMIGKVEETGASWNSIMWKIRNEADMSENRYDGIE